MRNDDLRIFIATQVRAEFPEDPHYIPVQSGTAVAPQRLGYLADDTGANISYKNPFYSELSVFYWAWKNSKNSLVGLSHNRRFFAPRNEALPFRGAEIASGKDLSEELTYRNIILPSPIPLYFDKGIPCSVEANYVGTSYGHDLVQARRAIESVDSAYLYPFDFVMRNHQLIPFNMLVAHKAVFDSYATWLFRVLLACEQLIPFETYEFAQQRVFGFLAERLMNVWLAHNRKDLHIGFRNCLFLPIPDAS